jgi:hypothetical protein
MEYSQVERHRFLIPTFKGSNPFTPKSLFGTFRCCFVKITFAGFFGKTTFGDLSGEPISSGFAERPRITRSLSKAKVTLS